MSGIAPNLVLSQQRDYDTDLIWTSAVCIYAEKNDWKAHSHWLYVRNETVIGLDYLCAFLLSECIYFHCKAVNIIKIFLSTKDD